MLLARLAAAIRRHQMFGPGDSVLIGCSGGPDSTALLDALDRLRSRLGITLEVATVNHGLRPEAADECDHVRVMAEKRGLICHVLSAHLESRSQDAARRARLALLEVCARTHGLSRIALAHTRSDQAETVVMRMLRGTGRAGLSGIAPVRGMFVRPLLDVSRSEVEDYLRERHLSPDRDPSNKDRRYLRVRVRLDILPMLRRENPRIEEALANLAANLREQRGETVTPPLTRAHLRALAGAMENPGGTRILHLPNQRLVEVRVGTRGTRQPVVPFELCIEGPGRYAIAALGQTLILEANGEGTRFDPAALPFPLLARTRRPGDRIRLPGGTRKISDVLIDAKIPRPERDRVLLLCVGARVLWVAGIAQAAGTQPKGGDTLGVRIQY